MRKSINIGKTINGFDILDSQCINKRTYYKVRCIYCKKEQLKVGYAVNIGTAKCKCRYIKNNGDGRSKDRLYRVYNRIKNVTLNPKNPQYYMYGKRGIKMYEEWANDYYSFKKWAYKNGYDENAPRGKCTIDRIDVNGDYEPSNCRFITIQEQQSNKTTNHYEIYQGERKTLKQWSKILNINYQTLVYKINKKGMTIEDFINKN